MRKNFGFTLIEMLMVIGVIAVLATMMFVFLSSARERGRDARRVRDMDEITKALELYYLDYGTYPQTSGPETIGDGAGEIEAELAPYFSGPSPRDPVNNAQFFYRYYPNHCVSKEEPCGPSSCSATGVVIGFSGVEGDSFTPRQDTCRGELWDAPYNKAFIP